MTRSAHAGAYTYTDLYSLGKPSGFNAASAFQIAAGGQVVGYGYGTIITGDYDHALLWNATSGNAVDLNPAGLYESIARASNGTQQVGYGDSSAGGYDYHALLWNGSASNVADLNPSGFAESYGLGISRTQQVGYGYVTVADENNYFTHALLWNGSAGSAVDLNPNGFTSSQACSTNGMQQVGYGSGALTGNNNHALVWNGSAGSFVDLNPSGFTVSEAIATSGAQQVGFGEKISGGAFSALLWNGSAGSAVNLNPSGFANSDALDTSGTQQVGYGYSTRTDSDHALVWSGTVGSYVDLQSILPSTFTGSEAYSISGNTIYGISTDTSYNEYAFEWQAVSSLPAITVASGQTYQFAFNASSGISTLTVGGLIVNSTGRVTFPAASNQASRQLVIVNGVGLSLAGTTGNWTGLIDVSNNDLDVAGGSFVTITDQIRQGYNGGKWNGSGGIASSAAAGDTTHLTALGVIQNNQSGMALFTASNQFDGTTPGVNDILVKYTYYGDANLDGKVDGSDYSLIDSGFLTHATGWFNGDFNYDGVVNGSDYTLIDNAFNQQGAELTTEFANSTAEVASVPEPAIASVIGLAALGLLQRRRRLI